MKSRFSRWDGSQDPLGSDIDVREVLEELSDELLSGYGMRWSLRELQRRGMAGRSGLDSLLRRLREQRQRLAEQTNLSAPLQRVRRELDEILGIERAELAMRTDDDSRMKELMLDAIPHHPAAAMRELAEYPFASSEAAARFQRLQEEVRQEVLGAYFRNLMGAMKNITPEDVARIKDMLAELNEMIAADKRGDPYDFEGFMERYGDFFPENPQNLQELLEIMARRMAAMSRMLASLSPQQRAELAELASSVLEDLDLAWQMDQLPESLRALMPELPWDEASPYYGDQEMPMSSALDAIERMSDLEDLEHSMSGGYAGATLDDIDEERLRRNLGEDALTDLKWLKEIERALEEAGVARRRGDELELTPKGARMLGERSLTSLLENIRRDPTHRATGGQAEPTGQTRRWTFGDPDPLSVEKTVYNAVLRAGGGPVGLKAEDFEVIETETRPRTATALLLDLSMSMPLRGHWLPAKKMALALHSLIDSKYPQDSLYLVGFSDYARRMEPADLASTGWEQVQGTNMQHAFLLARRLLMDDPRSIKQVIMVTDGEPTAHLENGYAYFNWPPIPITIETTLREAMRLARCNIAINVFMLEDSPGLEAFMRKMAKLTGGKTYLAPSSDIGRTVIDDYLRLRSRRRSA